MSQPTDKAPPREWQYVGRFISPNGAITAILDGPKIEPGGDKFWLVHKDDYAALKERCERAEEARNKTTILLATEKAELTAAQARVESLEVDLSELRSLHEIHRMSELSSAYERDQLRQENEKLRAALAFKYEASTYLTNPSSDPKAVHALVSCEVASNIRQALAGKGE